MAFKEAGMLTESEIFANETYIIDLLRKTKREGIRDYIHYLKNSDFFIAPASTKYHRNYPGGLAEHCLNLLEPLKLSNSRLKRDEQLPEDSLVITALCHDVCKEGLYIGEYGNYRTLEGHPANNKHSTLSIERIKRYIRLTRIERDVILYHMGLFSCYEYGMEYTPEDLMKAIKRHPLVQIFAAIDMEETHWQR
ncbi:3'-_5' exoribonuclease Bsu YhaM [Methanosarcina thermophila CHTI-55]|uniref:3'->5' exoribonuclease Bsu YhaM n=3 Tax=Methanosarcina thermophila TaxID=2210 RepID=A0A0E3L1L7_METTE|nr:3'->5' exoribonuclease Bsu YhaM [Methanosarcina thermophila CHTI-55]